MNRSAPATSLYLTAVLLCVALVLAACGSNQAYVESRFAALHGCKPERVMSSGGDWVLTGCGVRARFTCFDTQRHELDDYERYGNRNVLREVLFDDFLFSDDVCVQEQVESVGGDRVITDAPDPLEIGRNAQGAVRMSIAAPIYGAVRADMSLVGLPEHADPAVALRMAIVHDSALPDPCKAGLWIDGVRSEPPQLREKDGKAVRIALTSVQLMQLARSEHSAVDVCGTLVELDTPASARVRHFEQRFSDARVRLLPKAPAPAPIR